MTIAGVLSDAFVIYRRLLRRSIVVAGLIFCVVGLADALAQGSGTAATQFVSLVLGLIGGLLVQGALIEAVTDLHEGRPAGAVKELYDRTRGRLGTLLGVSFLYAIGVLLGALLLVVPGLILLARWALIVPLVVIEGCGWSQALGRSSTLVAGRTGRVLAIVILTNVITIGLSLAVIEAFLFLPAFGATWVGSTVAGALVVPFEAHVLSVLYYRLTEPGRPVLPGLTRSDVLPT